MRYLFLRLVPTSYAMQVEWARMEDDHLVAKGSCDEISDVPIKKAGEKLIVTIPGEAVLLTEVVLPGMNRQRLRKAIPFAVEDQLVDDVNTLHFVLGTQDDQGKYAVAVIESSLMKEWLALFDEADVSPDVMIPDTLALPLEEHAWSVFLDNGYASVRTGEEKGFVADQENLALLLSGSLQAEEEGPGAINIYNSEQDDKFEKNSLYKQLDIAINQLEYDEEHVVFLAKNYSSSLSKLNLLQGDFSRRDKISRHIKPWIPVAAMFLVWLVFQLSVDIYHYVELSKESDVLQQQMSQLFKKNFPQARNVRSGNEYAQMVSRFKSVKKVGGQGNASMQHMLSFSAPILMAVKGLELESISFRNGRLDLKLTVKDFKTLEDLQQKLKQGQNWEVEIQDTEPGENKVSSRLQIRVGAT